MAIAEKHNLYVIEDNAQGIGATYTDANGNTTKTGGIGHVGSTSFFPPKISVVMVMAVRFLPMTTILLIT